MDRDKGRGGGWDCHQQAPDLPSADKEDQVMSGYYPIAIQIGVEIQDQSGGGRGELGGIGWGGCLCLSQNLPG